MAGKFKQGDIVRFKSGGPAMTIDAVQTNDRAKPGESTIEYGCRWFKGASAEWGQFGEHLLETFVPPKK
jgi:uncharacterized protein YodC (DUF2158 family)